ncbi:hypothetical protein ACM9HJ_25430 [Niveispirillum sp. KHB5.9]
MNDDPTCLAKHGTASHDNDEALANQSLKPGAILAALRRSPLVGAELDLSRPWNEGRKIDL